MMPLDLAEAGFSTMGNRFIIAGGISEEARENHNNFIYEFNLEDEMFYKLPEELLQWVKAPAAVLTGDLENSTKFRSRMILGKILSLSLWVSLTCQVLLFSDPDTLIVVGGLDDRVTQKRAEKICPMETSPPCNSPKRLPQSRTLFRGLFVLKSIYINSH